MGCPPAGSNTFPGRRLDVILASMVATIFTKWEYMLACLRTQNYDSTMQKDLFLQSEGDRFFLRNKNKETMLPHLDRLAAYIKPKKSVLEIGCGYGRNLGYFESLLDIKAHGIDPSKKAIAEGKKKFPKLKLHVGSAESLPFKDNSMDFVYLGFFLYLVDRDLILSVFAECDRVLKTGGFLALTDFDGNPRTKTKYTHAAGVYSYRMDYQALLQSVHYQLAEKIPFSHKGPGFVVDPRERIAHSIYYKDGERVYLDT